MNTIEKVLDLLSGDLTYDKRAEAKVLLKQLLESEKQMESKKIKIGWVDHWGRSANNRWTKAQKKDFKDLWL